MNALLKILLVAFIACSLVSCVSRKSNYHKWNTRHHYKRYYHKGNNFGGRRLWVRYF